MLIRLNDKTKIIVLITFFSLLFIGVLIRFVPTFGRADLNDTAPIYRENTLHFNSLSRREQVMYDAIVKAIVDYADYTPEVAYVYTSNEFGRIVDCIIADHPEYFYVDFDRVFSFVSETDTKVRLSYFEDSNSADKLSAELSDRVDEIISLIPDGASDFETELFIHDYLVDACEYLTGSTDNYLQNTAYGALVNGKAFCAGYALAFKMLMNKCGLYCSVVSGQANGYSHMWNIVCINDKFYHVDVTWDDSDWTDSDMTFHGYLNVTYEQISSSHKVTAPSNLPMADSDDDNYYVRIGHTADSHEELGELLYKLMTECAENGDSWFELGLDYEGADEDLREVFTDIVKKINSENKYTFADVFRDHDCSDNGRYKNIEIFYEVNR